MYTAWKSMNSHWTPKRYYFLYFVKYLLHWEIIKDNWAGIVIFIRAILNLLYMKIYFYENANT